MHLNKILEQIKRHQSPSEANVMQVMNHYPTTTAAAAA